ncbi:MAG: hypothetical protein JWN90_460 [Parcubacteria group bacterium]|nr:hypothetical protein [Parcubacteria group bacterium]
MKFSRVTAAIVIAALSGAFAAPAVARSVDSKVMAVTNTAIGDPGGNILTQSYAGVTRDSNMTLTAALMRASSDATPIGLLDTKTAGYLDRSRRQGLTDSAVMQPISRAPNSYRSPSGLGANLDMTVLNSSFAGNTQVDLAANSLAT